MKKFLLAVTCALFALALVPSVSQGAVPQANPDELAVAITQPSVVYLEQYWSVYVKVPRYGYLNNGHPFKLGFRCSGFIVNPDGYIVTAGHCINVRDFIPEAASSAVAFLWNTKAGQSELFSLILRGEVNGSDSQSDVVARATANWAFQGQATGAGPDLQVYVQRGTVTGGKKDGEALPARVIGSEPLAQGDVSVLKIEKSNLPSIKVTTTSDLAVGTPIIAVGYPGNVDQVADQSLDPSFNDGKVNAKKTLEGGLIPSYQVDASLSGGQSGGPVVNQSGDVVGLVSQGVGSSVGGGSFNFISTASLINEMLARTGVKNTLSSDDVAWRVGLAAYFKGDGKSAVKQFQSMQDQTRPGYADYLRKAQAVAKTQGGFPIVIVIVALAVLLIGGGVVAMLMSRKGKARAVTPMPTMTPPEMASPATPQMQTPAPMSEPASPAEPVTPAAPVISTSTWQAPVPAATPPAADEPAPAPQPATVVQPASSSQAEQAAAPAPSPVTTHVSPPNGASSAHRYCSKCGNPVGQGINFCPNCGNAVA